MSRTPDYLAEMDVVLSALRVDPEDPRAWTRFYGLTAPRIRAQLYLLGERKGDRIEDVTQEVLVRFLRYNPWPDWRVPNARVLFAYLRTIVRSTLFDDLAKKRPELETESSGQTNPDAIAAPGLKDLRDVLATLSEALTPEEQVLLALMVDGRKLNDIADILGIEYSAAGVRRHRLKRKLLEFSRKSR